MTILFSSLICVVNAEWARFPFPCALFFNKGKQTNKKSLYEHYCWLDHRSRRPLQMRLSLSEWVRRSNFRIGHTVITVSSLVVALFKMSLWNDPTSPGGVSLPVEWLWSSLTNWKPKMTNSLLDSTKPWIWPLSNAPCSYTSSQLDATWVSERANIWSLSFFQWGCPNWHRATVNSRSDVSGTWSTSGLFWLDEINADVLLFPPVNIQLNRLFCCDVVTCSESEQCIHFIRTRSFMLYLVRNHC